MPITIHRNGQRFSAPDGTDPMELEAYATQFQEANLQRNPIIQGLMSTFNNASEQMAQPATTLAGVSPRNVVGMTFEQQQQMSQNLQGANQFTAAQKLRERAMREQQMEAEKDRAQDIKLQQAQYQNQQKLEQFRAKQEEDRLRKEVEMEGSRPIEVSPGATLAVPDGAGGYRSGFTAPSTQQPAAPKYVTVPGPDGKPMMRIATPEELQTGVPLYEKPAKEEKQAGKWVTDYTGEVPTLRLIGAEEGAEGVPVGTPPAKPANPLDTAIDIETLKRNIYSNLINQRPELFIIDEQNVPVPKDGQVQQIIQDEVARATGQGGQSQQQQPLAPGEVQAADGSVWKEDPNDPNFMVRVR